MGYSDILREKLSNAVACPEMLKCPPLRPEAEHEDDLSFERLVSPALEVYRWLFRMVGEAWMWVSRLLVEDEQVSAIISDPLVEIYSKSNCIFERSANVNCCLVWSRMKSAAE